MFCTDQHLLAFGLSGFDGLEGIDKPRDVRVKEETGFEKLLGLYLKIMDKYVPKLEITTNFFELESSLSRLYSELHDDMANLNLNFDEPDITSFVFSASSFEYTLMEEMLIRGLFTGNLVHLLTERNLEQGKRTRIEINGNGMKFDYLFCFAKVVDELIVRNFRGDGICSYVGSFDGEVNTLVVSDVVGQTAIAEVVHTSIEATLSNVGSHGGRVEQVISLRNKGGSILIDSGSHCYRRGYIHQIIVVENNNFDDNIGNYYSKVLHRIGCDFPNAVGQLIAVDIEGDGTFANCGMMPQLIAVDVKGKNIFGRKECSGIVNKVIYGFNAKESYTPIGFRPEIKFYSDGGFFDKHCVHPATDEEILSIARQLKGKDYPELLQIASKLYRMRPQ